MVTVMLLPSDRGRQDCRLLSSKRDQSHSRSLGSQPADDLVTNTVAGCHYNPPGLWLPSHS